MCFFQKEIYVKRKKKEEYVYEKRGVCLGVYIAKKSGAVKYLFCAIDDDKTLVIPATAIEERIETGAIYLKNLRTVLPTQCLRLTPFLPVYSIEGKYLGRLNGLVADNLTIQKLIVGEKKYPAISIDAVSDALLLNNLTYPLGEWSKEDESNVSRKLLKEKIRQGVLIRFTLSLSPFDLYKNA